MAQLQLQVGRLQFSICFPPKRVILPLPSLPWRLGAPARLCGRAASQSFRLCESTGGAVPVPASVAGLQMQALLSTVAGRVLQTAATLVSDENDSEMPLADTSQTEVEFADGLSCETFSAFPCEKLDSTWIMTPAQEAHAKAILEASGNVCDIRFKLCPARLSDEV